MGMVVMGKNENRNELLSHERVGIRMGGIGNSKKSLPHTSTCYLQDPA